MKRLLVLCLLLLGASPALAQNTISLLTLNTGIVGQSTTSGSFTGYPMTATGTYHGTAPTGIPSASWTGCGGGSATLWNPFAAQGYGHNGPAFITGQYPATTFSGQDGTFTMGVIVPATAGTGCTLTITDNRGASSTSPPTNVYNYPSGGELSYNVHNAPGWLHSHSYAPPAATATFTNGSANIAMTNVLTAGTPVYFETSGGLPTNFSVGKTYYAIATGLSGSNVQVSATVGGAAITAGSAGSGTQTGYAGGAHTRVNNGAGWTESTGVWNPGSALKAYELTSGSCTSAASGGPTGTGSSISDGTCTWKYLSDTDYVSYTGWLLDAPPWTSQTYVWGTFVTVNTGGINRAYALADSTPDNSIATSLCTSTVAPSGVGDGFQNGTTLGQLTTADGCVWGYWGDVLYSSQTSDLAQHSALPESQYTQGSNNLLPQSRLARPYTALLWNDREYVAGSNSELGPFQVSYHLTRWGGVGGETTWWSCVGPTEMVDCPLMTVKAAPGEGFASGFTPSVPLSGYDPVKGVAIRNPNITSAGGGSSGSRGLRVGDFNVEVQGLQIKSETSDGLVADNWAFILDNIIDGGYPAGSTLQSAVWGDVPVIVANNLIISHGWNGLAFKYGSSVALFNTIVNAGSTTDAVCITYQWAWVWANLIAANNACYNWPHFGAYSNSEPTQVFDATSKNNVTDTHSPDSGTVPIGGITTTSGTVMVVPNSTYDASGSSMFVAPGTDWRPGPALIGAGASYGTFTWGCAAGAAGCVAQSENFDTPDAFGTARPQSSSWTVGVEQAPSGAPPSSGLHFGFTR